MKNKEGTCLHCQERHLKNYRQEEASSPSSHQEAGARATEKMRGWKKKMHQTICVDGDSESGDHHEVRGRCHGHRRGCSSTEGGKWPLTDDNVNGGIKYCRDGSQCHNRPSTTTVATPSAEPDTNSIDGGTKYHCGGIQHSN